jgi:tetratricopeptide (TPR) repeat protein
LLTADTPRFSAEVEQHYASATLVRLLGDGGVELRRAASLALGILGDADAIEPLGRRLGDPDRGVRLAADDAFRGLMIREAAPVHQQKLLRVMHLNDGGEFAAALAPGLILADEAPHYAEAHHQLAVCWMGLGDLVAAESAFRSCLWLRRFHYAAWVGLAHCRLQGEDPDLADLDLGLRALRRAIAICPDLESPRLELRRLERAIEGDLFGDDEDARDGSGAD